MGIATEDYQKLAENIIWITMRLQVRAFPPAGLLFFVRVSEALPCPVLIVVLIPRIVTGMGRYRLTAGD